MTTLFLRPDRAIDPLMLEVARHVAAVAETMGLPYFIAGATARDLLLTGVFGVATGRATRDVDFAIAVESWEQFETLKRQLVTIGMFEASTRAEHRLVYRPSGYPLDIIPFRGVEQADHRVAWPPDMKVIMNLVGYEEALTHAEQVVLEEGLAVRVVSLPGLALLKVFAWMDRRDQDSKDAIDLTTLLRCYAHAGNFDRLYGEAAALMDVVDYDPELASPRLLGTDVRRMVTTETLERVLTLLDSPYQKMRLCTDMARGLRSAEDPLVVAEQLVDQFHRGLAG